MMQQRLFPPYPPLDQLEPQRWSEFILNQPEWTWLGRFGPYDLWHQFEVFWVDDGVDDEGGFVVGHEEISEQVYVCTASHSLGCYAPHWQLPHGGYEAIHRRVWRPVLIEAFKRAQYYQLIPPEVELEGLEENEHGQTSETVEAGTETAGAEPDDGPPF
jgi:hypothetical protein